jgi:hypothetical protein
MYSYGNYRILPEKELMVMYLSGRINVEEFIAICNLLIKDPEFNTEFNILIDFKDTTLDFNREGVERMVTWIEQNARWPRRSAYLTQTPNQVATTMMYDNLLKGILPVKIRICSTVKKAMDWVGLSHEDQIEVEDMLALLKDSLAVSR